MLEASGALGDLGTLIPLLAACAKKDSIEMGPAIFWMGFFNIVSGLQWDIPMPVQPMKSIAAVAIADDLAAGPFAAAGIITGAVVMILGITQTIELANKFIPECVISGMQVGLGIKMAAQGCGYWHRADGSGDWAPEVDCKTVMLITFICTTVMLYQCEKIPCALIVFIAGVILTIIDMTDKEVDFDVGFLKLSTTTIEWPDDWSKGLIEGALPQLPLTTLNSCVSVCALSVRLFGDEKKGGKGVTRVSVASSVGIMNLVGCWFGGMPSCHGAGGLAGQHKFGARSGMAIFGLGIVKVLLAGFLGESLGQIIDYYPTAVLGVLLLFAGVELASVGADNLRKVRDFRADLTPCMVTAGGYIGTKNMALGTSAGLVAVALQRLHRWRELKFILKSDDDAIKYVDDILKQQYEDTLAKDVYKKLGNEPSYVMVMDSEKICETRKKMDNEENATARNSGSVQKKEQDV